MKKKLVVYLAGLLTVLGLGFGQAQFSDVPAGHWAKEAVERIAACGLITGFPDGTFRGNTNLTRYQAALIFQRLLNEIQQGGECVKGEGGGMSDEDMTAIRNAVQELAAELAALGVRVSALEDNAASKDDIARLEAAIEELKAMKAEPSGMDEAALADLADRVEAASVAADTALAQAQILAERLDGVEGDVAALKTQVEADADSIRALNELAVLLNQDVLSLQDRVTALEKQLGDVDFDSFANREDVSAIQEFATALRSDLVRLSDRVSNLDTRVSGIDSRLAAVEATRPTLTGSLSATYGYSTNTGRDFDIDRLFPGNALSSGGGADDVSGNRIRNAFRRGDFNQTFTGGSASLNFGLKPTGGAISEVTLGMGAGLFNTGTDPDRAIKLNSASVKGSLSGQAFSITYDSGGSTFSFNPYLFNNSTRGLVTTRGFVATLDAKAFPLTPKFTIVAGEGFDDSAIPSASRIYGTDATYAGLRAELNLLGIATGLSYAENRGNRSAFGVDYKGSLFGLLNLEGAFVASTPFGTPIDFSNQLVTDQAFYTKLGVKLGIIELNANYRAIDPQYNNGQAGMSPASGFYFFGMGGNGEAPYGANNRGFGLDGKLTLPILGGIEVRGLYDNSADFATGTLTADTLSVGATIPLFAGFSLNPFFNNTNVSGAQVSGATGGQSGLNGNYNFYVYNNLDARWSSGWGIKLVHSGRASNALISGLDLNLWYQSFAGPNAGTDILASAGYNGKLGFLSINPIIRYHSFSAQSPSSTTLSSNALKYGIGASTDPLDIFLKPSLEGTFVTQSINVTAPALTPNSSSEQYWRVGLNLNEFLAAGSVFKVGYASYSATNVSSPSSPAGVTTPERGFGNFPLSITTDRVFTFPGEVQFPWNLTTGLGTNSGSVTGLYLEWKYGNLTMAAASATLADSVGTPVSTGTGFKINYEVKY